MQPDPIEGPQTVVLGSHAMAIYQRGLIVFALLYTLFVIYGSLVPLQFVHKEFGEVLQSFSSIRYYSLGLASRADWVANILLFVPLSYAYLELVTRQARIQVIHAIIASVAILTVSALLSLSIEFVQIYFPQRTVSLNDVIGETMGAAIGLILWWLFASKWRIWLLRFCSNMSVASRIRQSLYGYLAALLFYNLLPLDLTLSPYALYDKWQAGNIRLVPLSVFLGDTAEALYGLVTDVIIWLPIGALLVLDKPLRRLSVAQALILLAGVIEFLQLFVYSRVTDLTDVFTALLGGWLGAIFMRPYVNRYGAKNINSILIKQKPSSKLKYYLLLFFFAPMMLCILFWYPFNFHFSVETFHARIGKLFSVPFMSYYFGTEYRAVTELTRRVLFFLPLGVIGGFVMAHGSGFSRARLLLMGLYVFVVATIIELGQVMLPDKFPNSTDIVLATLGGVFGMIGIKWILLGLEAPQGSQDAHKVLAPVVEAPSISAVKNGVSVRTNSTISPHVYLSLLLAASIVIWFIGTWHGMPYNIRELFDTGFPFATALFLSLFAAWVFVFPVLLMDWVQRSPSHGWLVLCYPLIHGAVAWLLLFVAVPVESIDDLVGYPILDMPAAMERLGRFIALFSWLSMSLWFSLACVKRLENRALIWSGTAIAVPIWLLISYKLVVDWAATDNITELMANNASFSSVIWLFLALWLMYVPASYAVHRLDIRHLHHVIILLALLPVCVVLAFFCAKLGTEQWIVKYDRVFSALQFLLSRDRDNYVADNELFFRFLILNLAITLLMIFYQWPIARRQYGAQRNSNLEKR